jgi:hypothetical protein
MLEAQAGVVQIDGQYAFARENQGSGCAKARVEGQAIFPGYFAVNRVNSKWAIQSKRPLR